MARLKLELRHTGEPIEVVPAVLTSDPHSEFAPAVIQVPADLNTAVATDLEAAKAKIKAMFSTVDAESPAPPVTEVPPPETIANGIPLDAIAPPEPVVDPARLEMIAHLVDLQWRHSDAVWVANRARELMEEHSITAEYARENAIYEFHRRDPGPEAPVVPAEKTRGARVKEMVAEAIQPAEPVEMQDRIDAVQAIQHDAAQLTEGGTEELTQVVHNLQRDIARLVRLLGLEGVRKSRKKKES